MSGPCRRYWSRMFVCLEKLRLVIGVGCASVGACAVPALGQSAYRPSEKSGLQRVEQGVADISPLSKQMRVLQPRLSVPSRFEDVYAFRDERGRERFARVSGAVTAVFPQSEYVLTRQGVAPAIPAGTVFHIGGLKKFEDIAPVPGSASAARPGSVSSAASTMSDSRASFPIAPVQPGAEPRKTTRPPGERGRVTATEPPASALKLRPPVMTMLTNEGFRRSRVRELLTSVVARPIVGVESDGRK